MMNLLARRSLKTQFIVSFVLILALSLAATVITYLAAFRLFSLLQYKRIYPANHFERQVPQLEETIRQLGTAVLADDAILAHLIPKEGFKYQVLDGFGRFLYGTETGDIIGTRSELHTQINTTISHEGRFVRVIPIFSDESLQGAVALVYQLTPYIPLAQDRLWLIPMGVIVILSPFVFIVLFTYIFARRFAKSIGEPVNMLIEASHKVQAQDLDFAVEYQADNELGRLCQAFNEMKETLKESLLAQWQAQQQHQEMVAALAHDLKTPFAIIQGYAQALLGEIDHRAKAKKYLQVIADNARRGGRLVQEMLYAAELEASQPSIPTEFDLTAFLKDKLDVYRGMGAGKNISVELELSLSEEKPLSVRLDQDKLSRILDNIVMNSLYYTQASGTIALSARTKGQTLHIAVCDTGPGFTPQDLRHLFDKFYRGDQSRTLEVGQSGLGLYIVKQLVEAQGGTVRAYSRPTGGACVEFSLPI